MFSLQTMLKSGYSDVSSCLSPNQLLRLEPYIRVQCRLARVQWNESHQSLTPLLLGKQTYTNNIVWDVIGLNGLCLNADLQLTRSPSFLGLHFLAPVTPFALLPLSC